MRHERKACMGLGQPDSWAARCWVSTATARALSAEGLVSVRTAAPSGAASPGFCPAVALVTTAGARALNHTARGAGELAGAWCYNQFSGDAPCSRLAPLRTWSQVSAPPPCWGSAHSPRARFAETLLKRSLGATIERGADKFLQCCGDGHLRDGHRHVPPGSHLLCKARVAPGSGSTWGHGPAGSNPAAAPRCTAVQNTETPVYPEGQGLCSAARDPPLVPTPPVSVRSEKGHLTSDGAAWQFLQPCSCNCYLFSH